MGFVLAHTIQDPQSKFLAPCSNSLFTYVLQVPHDDTVLRTFMSVPSDDRDPSPTARDTSYPRSVSTSARGNER